MDSAEFDRNTRRRIMTSLGMVFTGIAQICSILADEAAAAPGAPASVTPAETHATGVGLATTATASSAEHGVGAGPAEPPPTASATRTEDATTLSGHGFPPDYSVTRAVARSPSPGDISEDDHEHFLSLSRQSHFEYVRYCRQCLKHWRNVRLPDGTWGPSQRCDPPAAAPGTPP